MPRCIAFHSYKGGTGKTTIAANLAGLLAKKGFRVLLADFDVYAPSLYVYFGLRPAKWVNDYLFGNAQIEDIMVDMTEHLPSGQQISKKSPSKKEGKLWVAFSNPQKDEIYKLDLSALTPGTHSNSNLQILRRFIRLKEEAILKHNIDYLIMDTSPGIKYWSVNSLAIADTLMLTLKMDDFDVEGTRQLAGEVYESFSELGTKSYLLLNRVSGYCVPIITQDASLARKTNFEPIPHSEADLEAAKALLVGSAKMEIISSIPCYCDIQFNPKEFLTCLNHPNHAFAKELQDLAESEKIRI
jgi:MinD-like ATPase involved in chromosome partitioning or flagellar assembly